MKKSLVIVVVLIVVAGGVFWLWLFRQNTANPVRSREGSQRASTSNGVNAGTVTVLRSDPDLQATSEATKAILIYEGDPIENIGSDPFIQQVPADYLEKYKQELANFKKAFTENPGDAEGWLRVGVLKKFFNNYAGARDAWEYVKIINPELSTSYYNLGGLYAGYLRDNFRAEENYLKAIEIDPSLPYLYLGLAELYAVFYPEKKDRADDIILKGLEVNPDAPSLLQALESYKP